MIKIEDTVLYCVELTWGQKTLHYIRVKKSDVDKFDSIENELRNIVYMGSTEDKNTLQTFGNEFSISSGDPCSDIYEINESDAAVFEFCDVDVEDVEDDEPEFPDVFLVPGRKKSKLVRIKIAT